MYRKEWEKIETAIRKSVPEYISIHYGGQISENFPQWVGCEKETDGYAYALHSDGDYDYKALLSLSIVIGHVDAITAKSFELGVEKTLKSLAYDIITGPFCHSCDDGPVILCCEFKRNYTGNPRVTSYFE